MLYCIHNILNYLVLGDTGVKSKLCAVVAAG